MSIWHTVKTGAKYAAVSEWSIREAVKEGDLPAHSIGKSGRHYRLYEDEIKAWLLSRDYEPPSERGA